MILKNVFLKNFMCYYGESTFEFSEGLNVIIGDNGYGKSKLFDAIYWVMYDECFDTSADKFMPTRHLADSLLSDKSIAEAQDGETVECLVQLEFFDEKREEIYNIERALRGSKKGTEFIVALKSDEKFTKRRSFTLEGQIVDDEERIKSIKRRILPDNIKPYMWFQGEQIDSIIDFKNSETRENAINILSDIKRFDDVTLVTDSFLKTVENEKTRRQRALSSDEQKSDDLQRQINSAKVRLENYERDLRQAEIGLKETDAVNEELISKLNIADKIRDLDSNRKQIQIKFDNLENQIQQIKSQLNKGILSEGWLLKGTEELFQRFSDKYKLYTEKKQDLKVKLLAEKTLNDRLQTRLPINVPEPIHVQKMLEVERCLVCDRVAKKGTKEYEAIESLLTKSSETISDLEKQTSNRLNFSSDLEKLYREGLKYERKIPNIDQDIDATLEKIEELNAQRDEFRTQLEEIEFEIKNYVTENTLDVSEANRISNKLRSVQQMTGRFSTDIGSYKKSIESVRREIADIEQQISSLVVQGLPASLTKKVELANDLNAIAKSTRKRVFKELIEELEKEANEHYKKMIQGNKSARGIIHLKEFHGNYTPELVDDEGTTLTQINMGNILLIKLATIMAIISARKSTKSTDLYTLISDAPMSVFGEDYTIGFCKTVSQVYKQSIIMSKDFYKNESLRTQLLSGEDINLGKVYMIEPNLKDAERENRNKLTTLITELN
jgi:DNA sulfur modification protein DndD